MSGTFTSAETYSRYQSDALTLRLARFVWAMHLLTAGLMGGLVLSNGHLPTLLVVLWVLWMISLGCVQGVVSFRGSNIAQFEGDLSGVVRVFDVTTILLACGYGVLAFAPTGDAELDQFAGFIVGGGILTGVGTHNPRYRTLIVTLIIIIPLMALRALIDAEGGRGLIAAAMLIVFLFLMLGLGWVLRGFSRRGFNLQWDKIQLAEQLKSQAEQLKIARADAEAANLAKSKFLAQASHDLRQPLHSMGLFLASLQHEKLTPRAREITDRLNQSVDILSELFSSLLDVTLMDTQKTEFAPVATPLRALLEDIQAEFAPTSVEHSIRIECPDALFIRADALILRRMVQNLVSNALRHTKDGDITLSADVSPDGVSVRVQDSGPGIPDAEQIRIFQEFERGMPVGSGTRGLGLGLSIVQRLAQASGVSVSLHSKQGVGSAFSIGQFKTEDAPLHLTTDNADASDHSASGRVLIVDDDEPTLEATATILSKWGWDMDARTHLSTADVADMPPPDLVITDYDLGEGMTGLDVISRVRARFPDIPALIISGSSTEETRERVKQAGFTFLHKPVRPVQLRSALIALVG